MKKIRTGNDIKVIFTIKGPASTDTVNMKQLRVYFVNNSSETHCCVKRFPKEPFPQFYEPTKYTVHGCGKFEYNVNPSYNKCEYAVCMGNFHDYHIWPNYNGFGINPKKFDDCCHCCCFSNLCWSLCINLYGKQVRRVICLLFKRKKL